MDIDRAVLRHGKNIVRQNPAVGHHNQNIRGQGLDLGKSRAIPHLLRLIHRDIVGQCKGLYGRKAHLHAPALGLVRLGKYAHHGKALVNHFFQ